MVRMLTNDELVEIRARQMFHRLILWGVIILAAAGMGFIGGYWLSSPIEVAGEGGDGPE